MSTLSQQIVWYNGKLMAEEQASISCQDAAFLYGLGVFTTIRINDGEPLFWGRHMRRLLSDAGRLGIATPTPDDLATAAKTMVKASNVNYGRMRITLTNKTTLVTAHEGLPYLDRHYEKGFHCAFAQGRRDPNSILAGVKSTAYAENLLAREEAKAAGCDECLFLDTSGRLSEGSATNVFMFRNGCLYTPGRDTGLLPGITRDVLMEVLPAVGIMVREADIRPNDLDKCDELFLTNSLMGLMPVTCVAGMKIGSGAPGPLTKQAQAALLVAQQDERGWQVD